MASSTFLGSLSGQESDFHNKQNAFKEDPSCQGWRTTIPFSAPEKSPRPKVIVSLVSTTTAVHWEAMCKTGGGFKCFFIFTPTWGNDPIWLYIFFKWVEPTRKRWRFLLGGGGGWRWPRYWASETYTELEIYYSESVKLLCCGFFGVWSIFKIIFHFSQGGPGHVHSTSLVKFEKITSWVAGISMITIDGLWFSEKPFWS